MSGPEREGTGSEDEPKQVGVKRLFFHVTVAGFQNGKLRVPYIEEEIVLS